MKSPHLVEGIALTPIGAAVVEMHKVRGWDFYDAVEWVSGRFEHDCSVPVSGLFPAEDVAAFYEARGELVNVVPLPRTR